MRFEVSDEALGVLRRWFTAVEGTCEPWTDAEVVRRVLIRGAMEYVRSAGGEWEEVQATAEALRRELGDPHT